MAKKNAVIPTTTTPETPAPSLAAQRAANRVIGDIENIAPPARVGTSGLAPVWKDALAPLEIGQSRIVTGIGMKSLMQSVMKTGKKHWPERKFRVWVEKKAEENNGVEVLRVGRSEDRPVKQQEVKEASVPQNGNEVAQENAAPSTTPTVEPIYTAENPPPGYYYDPAGNQFLPIQAVQG